HVAAEQALNRGARAAIRHLVQLDAGRLLEQHGSEMERIADAGVSDIDFARLPFGLVDWSAPLGGDRYEAVQLAICRACSSSQLTGLLYPSAEWRRLAL